MGKKSGLITHTEVANEKEQKEVSKNHRMYQFTQGKNAKSPDHYNNDQGFLKNNLAAFYSPKLPIL